MNKISIVITAYNEEQKIEKCLASIKWADEIIVIDNESTDRTKQLAQKYTQHIYSHKNDPENIDIQKNFGFARATGEWILSVDADEIIPAELETEIRLAVSSNSDINGYWIPRQNIIFGKTIKYTGWYPDNQLRLFRNGKGKYTKSVVHQPLTIEGKVGYLTKHLIHNNYETIQQFIQKNYFLYAQSEADEKIKQGYTFSWKDCIWLPMNEFLSRFFAREGYKDGLHGLLLSLLMAGYHLMVFAYLWQEENFKQQALSLSELQPEYKKIGKDLKFWIRHEKLKNIKNPIKKRIKSLLKP